MTESPRRYRCTACGNLTRFDVTMTRTTKAFHHFTVGGELNIDEETVLSEDISEVSCRWCNSGAHVVERSIDDTDEEASVPGS